MRWRWRRGTPHPRAGIRGGGGVVEPLDGPLHRVEIRSGASCGREPRGFGFYGETEVDDVVEVVFCSHGPRRERRTELGHEPAAGRTAFRQDVSLGFECRQRLAHPVAAHAESRRELALGRQPVAGTELAAMDASAQLLDDLVRPRRRQRGDAHAESRAVVASTACTPAANASTSAGLVSHAVIHRTSCAASSHM